MRYIKKFNESKEDLSKPIKTIVIDFSDLIYMCKNNSRYFNVSDKNICSKFLDDGLVTNELLKLYCTHELESYGDMFNGIIEFIYKDKKIYGKWNKNKDYPVEISFNMTNLNEELSPYANWKDSDSIYVDEIPHYGDLFTIDEFEEQVEDQNIMHEDGIGYYSDGEHMARKFPVFYTKKPEGATHVVWFNK